jgi:hypothetical protein
MIYLAEVMKERLQMLEREASDDQHLILQTAFISII